MVLVPSQMIPLGTPAPAFSLPDTDGRTVSNQDFDGKPLLVIFMCNHCPYVQYLRDAIADITSTYLDQGVAVVGINSNDADKYPDDSPAKMKDERETWGYRFPYLFDATQQVAHAYKAACTPDFFLFDAEHKLSYRGQFDGARPGNDEPITGRDLKAALDAVLAGSDVPAEQKPSAGCNIKWKPGNAPAYFG